MKKLKLTNHSKVRIIERSSLSFENIISIAENGEYIRIGKDLNKKNAYHWIIYDSFNDEFFVLVVDEVKMSLITILNAEIYKNWMIDPVLFIALKNKDYNLNNTKDSSTFLKNKLHLSDDLDEDDIWDILNIHQNNNNLLLLGNRYDFLNNMNPKSVRKKIRHHFEDIKISEKVINSVTERVIKTFNFNSEKYIDEYILESFINTVNELILSQEKFDSQSQMYHTALNNMGLKQNTLLDKVLNSFHSKYDEKLNSTLEKLELSFSNHHYVEKEDILTYLAKKQLGIVPISKLNKISINIQNNFKDNDFLEFTKRPSYICDFNDFHNKYYSDEIFSYLVKKEQDFLIEILFKDLSRESFGFKGYGKLDTISTNKKCIESMQNHILENEINFKNIKAIYVYGIKDLKTFNPKLKRRKVF